MSVQKKRLICALLVAVAIICSGPALAALGSLGSAAHLVVQEDSKDFGADVPKAFADELIDAEGYADVRVSESQGIVGFTSELKAEEELLRLEKVLEDKGWKTVPSGSPVVSSFVKEEGEYVWALVSCTQMEKGCSVVVQGLAKEPAN